jgi:hypothetical protein
MVATGFFDEVMANMVRLGLGHKCVGVSWADISDADEAFTKKHSDNPELVDSLLCKLIISSQNNIYKSKQELQKKKELLEKTEFLEKSKLLEKTELQEKKELQSWERCALYPEEFEEFEMKISHLLHHLEPKVSKKVMAMVSGYKGGHFKNYTKWYKLGFFYHDKKQNIIQIRIRKGDDVGSIMNMLYHALKKNINHNITKYFQKKKI